MRTSLLLALAALFLASAAALAGKPGQRMSRQVKVGDVIASPTFGQLQTGWRGSVPSYSPRFARAKFVVEETKMAHGGHDTLGSFPAGWTVVARELHKDGTYNPRGATLEFMQSENHNDNVPPGQITLVKQMRLTFVDR